LASVGLTYAVLPPLDLSRYQSRSPTVSARGGELLHVSLSSDQRWRLHTQPSQVSPRYLQALLFTEDRYFYYHPGINPFATVRAAWQWIRTGRIVSGGSTITMQVARLLEPRPRTVLSKWVEMVRALELELRYSKDEILAMYLTMLPMGGNLESVRAASYRYFGAEPDLLSLSEVSILLAIPQSPKQRRPDRHASAARLAATKIAKRLIGEKLFEPQDIKEIEFLALSESLRFPNHAWHLTHAIAQKSQPQQLFEHKSTIDYRIQKQLENKARSFQRIIAEKQNIGAMIVDARNGEILGHLGSLGLASPAGYMDLTQAVRSPGSTLKPFIYGMAIDDRLINDQTVLVDEPKTFGTYAPSNFDSGHMGPIRAGMALQESLNVPAVEVLDLLGSDSFVSSWKRAGLSYKLPQNANPSVAIALGSVGIQLQTLVQAYAALANNGEVPALKTSIIEKAGPSKSLLTPETAKLIVEILGSAPTVEGRLQSTLSTKKTPLAFKTGTSYGYRDSWTVGTLGYYVIGVWVGRPDGAPTVGVTGRSVALRLAMELADTLETNEEIKRWSALPITRNDISPTQPQIISPVQNSEVLLREKPNLLRKIKVKLSNLSKQHQIYLNGERLSNHPWLPVPYDGTYLLTIKEKNSEVSRREFTVFTLQERG